MKLILFLWLTMFTEIIIACPCGYFGKDCKYFYNNSTILDFSDFPDYPFDDNYKFYLTYDNQIILDCKDGFTFNTFSTCVEDLCANFDCPIGHCQMVDIEPKCFCDGLTVQGNEQCLKNECLLQTHIDRFCSKDQSVCIDEKNGKFRCECNSDSFSGRYCEKLTNKCPMNTCQNGGTCVMVSTNSDCCMCLSGFTGSRCEINLNTQAPTTNIILTTQTQTTTVPSTSITIATSDKSTETTLSTTVFTSEKETTSSNSLTSSITSYSTENLETQLSTEELTSTEKTSTLTENHTILDSTSGMITFTQSKAETTINESSEPSTHASQDTTEKETTTISEYQSSAQSSFDTTNYIINLTQSAVFTTLNESSEFSTPNSQSTTIMEASTFSENNSITDTTTSLMNYTQSEWIDTTINGPSESTTLTTVSIYTSSIPNETTETNTYDVSLDTTEIWTTPARSDWKSESTEFVPTTTVVPSKKILLNCTTNPCKNGGECVLSFSNSIGYECICSAYYSGPNCEILEDDCSPGINPCQNNSTCSNYLGIGNYACDCKQSYHGKNCENQLTACSNSPCLNYGKCVDKKDFDKYNVSSAATRDFACLCIQDFYGDYCESEIDLCQNDVCLNGAVCKTFINLKEDNQTSLTNSTDDFYFHYYTCSCTSFFYGEKCQFQSDELKAKIIVSKTIGIASILSIVTLYLFVICMDMSKVFCRENSNQEKKKTIKRVNLKYVNFSKDV